MSAIHSSVAVVFPVFQTLRFVTVFSHRQYCCDHTKIIRKYIIIFKGYPDCPGGEDESNCPHQVVLAYPDSHYQPLNEPGGPASNSKSLASLTFNPFLIVSGNQQSGDPGLQNQDGENIFNPFQVTRESGLNSFGEDLGQLDPGEVVEGQVGSWEEDGSIFNPFALTEERSQLDWPRWGELELAAFGRDQEMGERIVGSRWEEA